MPPKNTNTIGRPKKTKKPIMNLLKDLPDQSKVPLIPGTIFTKKITPFPVVHDGHIETQAFLEASKGIIILVEPYSKIFDAFKHDLNRNILTIERKFNKNTEKYKMIEDLIMAERKACNALQWLRRDLQYILRVFQLFLRCDSREIKTFAHLLKVAYSETLAIYHGWIGTQLLNILCRFAPTRGKFLEVLAFNQQGRHKLVLRDMRIFAINLKSCIDHLLRFYITNKLEEPHLFEF